MKIISERIEALRTSEGLSQKELARELGLSKDIVARWANENTRIKLKYIVALYDYFNVSIDYLFGKTDKTHLE